MSWRFLCCVLITCGYIHQQNSDEKYRKYFDCILFQFKSLLLFPFFFFSCIYLFLKYCIEFLWNQFLFFFTSVGSWLLYVFVKELCLFMLSSFNHWFEETELNPRLFFECHLQLLLQTLQLQLWISYGAV